MDKKERKKKWLVCVGELRLGSQLTELWMEIITGAVAIVGALYQEKQARRRSVTGHLHPQAIVSFFAFNYNVVGEIVR